MTDEELDRARALEAVARYYEQIGLIKTAQDWRFGNTRPPDDITILAARLAREGWTPEDPRIAVAREMLARAYEAWSHPLSATTIRCENYIYEEPISYLARCLPEGMTIADLPPVEKDA